MKSLYYLLIVLNIFQDLPLANYVGEYGKSIVGIFSIFVLVFLILKQKKIVMNKTIKGLLSLLLYLLIFDCILLLIFLFFNDSLIVLGENIIVKSIKIFLYYFTNVIYLLTLYQLTKNMNEKDVLKPFYHGYILLFIILIIEALTLPSAFSFLHATRPTAYNRIRLLTSESSYTASLIWIFFVGSFLYCQKYKNKKSIILLILTTILFLVTTTSKSLLLMFIISILAIFISNKKVKVKYKIGLILFLAFTLLFLSDNVLSYFELAFTSSTTMYTRGYTFVIALIISLLFPLGVGNVYYLSVFTNFLRDNLTKVTNLIPNFNSSEIVYVLSTGTDKNISAYSGIIQYGMYWGIIGNIYFICKIWNGVKKAIKTSPILQFGFVGIAFALLTVISFDNKYEIWAFIFLLIYYNDRVVE